jgi:hypothetical protein
MAIRIARLGDPGSAEAPFSFRQGARVAWKRWDGKPDAEFAGVIVDGICEYVPGGGAYRDRYVVQRPDGLHFGAGALDLVEL